jgi:hypothetical protein
MLQFQISLLVVTCFLFDEWVYLNFCYSDVNYEYDKIVLLLEKVAQSVMIPLWYM